MDKSFEERAHEVDYDAYKRVSEQLRGGIESEEKIEPTKSFGEFLMGDGGNFLEGHKHRDEIIHMIKQASGYED
jgi:hypothetical protein